MGKKGLYHTRCRKLFFNALLCWRVTHRVVVRFMGDQNDYLNCGISRPSFGLNRQSSIDHTILLPWEKLPFIVQFTAWLVQESFSHVWITNIWILMAISNFRFQVKVSVLIDFTDHRKWRWRIFSKGTPHSAGWHSEVSRWMLERNAADAKEEALKRLQRRIHVEGRLYIATPIWLLISDNLCKSNFWHHLTCSYRKYAGSGSRTMY